METTPEAIVTVGVPMLTNKLAFTSAKANKSFPVLKIFDGYDEQAPQIPSAFFGSFCVNFLSIFKSRTFSLAS